MSVDTIKIAVDEIGKFLIVNGLSEELRSELRDEEVKGKLLSLLPKRHRTDDAFSLNCYYQIFRKRVIKDNDTEKMDLF